jgi:hypothetical protein
MTGGFCEGGRGGRRRFRQWFPLQSSFGSGLRPLCLCVFDLCLPPSWNKIPEDIYRNFWSHPRRWHGVWSKWRSEAKVGQYHPASNPTHVVGPHMRLLDLLMAHFGLLDASQNLWTMLPNLALFSSLAVPRKSNIVKEGFSAMLS